MAHTKAAGAAKRTVNVAGKRLGIKKYSGEYVKSGNIIVRQRGTKFHPGVGTILGKDHTIQAVADGFVSYKQMTGYKRNQKSVQVLATKTVEPKPAAKPKTITAPKPATKKAAPKAKK